MVNISRTISYSWATNKRNFYRPTSIHLSIFLDTGQVNHLCYEYRSKENISKLLTEYLPMMLSTNLPLFSSACIEIKILSFCHSVTAVIIRHYCFNWQNQHHGIQFPLRHQTSHCPAPPLHWQYTVLAYLPMLLIVI